MVRGRVSRVAGDGPAGLNLIELTWPGTTVSHETRMARDVDALARGEQPYVPIFGELYSVSFDPLGPDGSSDERMIATRV